VGVVLVLLSVVAGARLVAAADATDPWVTATAPLPTGHVLTDADLGTASVRLDDASSGRYFRADSRAALVGRALVVPVGAGQLLPADAVTPASAPASRVVPVVVGPGRLPALRPGDRVDVYALVKGSDAGADREVLVVSGVEYLGGEVLGSGGTAVQLRVAVGDAIRVVAASRSERVDLVRVDGSGTGVPDAGLPTEAPGLGG
jgi:Flp pilus assembly protein CpaB